MESPTTYRVAYFVLIIAWAVFWPIVGYSYHDSNKKQVEGRASRIPLVNRLLLASVFLASCVCLASPRWDSHLLWVAGVPTLTLGILLLLLLLGIAYYAARLLAWQPVLLGGRSATVFAEGPFAWLRHPTYACITIAAWITALLLARPLALYAATCVTVAHLLLILLEEKSTRQFDPAAHAAYAARVPMLIPWRLGRVPPPETGVDKSPTTGQALFAEAQPIISRRVTKIAAKQKQRGKGAPGKNVGARRKGKGRSNRKGKPGGEQPQSQVPSDVQSRAWQVLEGKQD